MMPTIVKASAMAPSRASSAPTDGPTNSVRDRRSGSLSPTLHEGRLTDSPSCVT